MLARKYRFHGYNSLNYAYKKGHSRRTQYMSLKYALNKRRERFRVAVVVSRKVHKSAVVRNRIRRRLYEIIRQNSAAISQPYDIVILVYSDKLATVPTDELSAIVGNLLSEAGIMEAQATAQTPPKDR